MDNKALAQIISNVSELKYKFVGSFAADQVPPLYRNSFVIINTDPSFMEGTHWIMLANKEGTIYYGDALGQPLSSYKYVKTMKVKQLVYSTIQTLPLCGFYCIYFAWTVFKGLQIDTFFNDFDLIQFIHKYM